MRHALAGRAQRGFSLIELAIAVAVVAILAGVAYPSYLNQVVRGSREAAKAELIELASLQEKIYLNSDAYSANVTSAYNGTAAGGLGRASGRTTDGKYTLGVVTASQTFTLTATPVTGTSQAADGNLVIRSDGSRTWGSHSW